MATYSDRGMRVVKTQVVTTGISTTPTQIHRASLTCAFAACCIESFTMSNTVGNLVVQIRNAEGTTLATFNSTAPGSTSPTSFSFQISPSATDTASFASRICGPLGGASGQGWLESGGSKLFGLGPCILLYPGDYVYVYSSTGSTNINIRSYIYESFGG